MTFSNDSITVLTLKFNLLKIFFYRSCTHLGNIYNIKNINLSHFKCFFNNNITSLFDA